MRSNLTVKISICWVTVCSVEEIHILKMESIIFFYRDMQYHFEISLMETGYSKYWLNHFSKELLKFIFNEIRFYKIYMKN